MTLLVLTAAYGCGRAEAPDMEGSKEGEEAPDKEGSEEGEEGPQRWGCGAPHVQRRTEEAVRTAVRRDWHAPCQTR